ncbi:hypothetical protein F66182_7595 [Fusarium sp. NRRL 66182]|nr:hypothetical protein F66182_7595 [Fusarium sp. NRRL 66182]
MRFFQPCAVFLSVLSAAGVTAQSSQGRLRGREIQYDNLTLYVTKPPRNIHASRKPGSRVGVLYLTDVYGLALEANKRLVDDFAESGFITVAPDFFDGASVELRDPTVNQGQFAARFPPSIADPIIVKSIAYLRDVAKVDKIVASGYCYGGRHVMRYLDGVRGGGEIEVGFSAHPSGLATEEIEAIEGPITIAAAAEDELYPLERLAETNAILHEKGVVFTSVVYSGTTHGFATRANESIPLEAYAKNEAFEQAVRFFNAWA